MNESDLQRNNKYPIYPRESKTYSDEKFVIIDSKQIGRTHWTAFYVKNIKSFYFDSFGGSPDKFLLNQLTKPIT